MRKSAVLTGVLISILLWASCAPNEMKGQRHYWSISPCKQAASGGVVQLAGVDYKPMSEAVCVAYLPPFDASGWFESNMNSHRVRGKSELILGCINCREACTYNCGEGCTTAVFNFDFTRIPEDSEIYSAKLAVYVLNRQDLMSRTELRGRANTGGDFALLDDAPQLLGNWALYDITKFACRASVERRNSTTLELSLPCNECIGSQPPQATIVLHDRSKLDANRPIDSRSYKVVGFAEPRIIFEYR